MRDTLKAFVGSFAAIYVWKMIDSIAGRRYLKKVAGPLFIRAIRVNIEGGIGESKAQH